VREILGREDGSPPPVDLSAEKRNGDFVRSQIRAGALTAVHDLSDGGLAIAIAEMSLASGLGATIVPPPGPKHAAWFGEDQARYAVTVPAGSDGPTLQAARAAGVPARRIGTVGGEAVVLAGFTIDLSRMRARHEGWFPRYMDAVRSDWPGREAGLTPAPAAPTLKPPRWRFRANGETSCR
jgi:phosphoribosylformylglycinamidine synthase